MSDWYPGALARQDEYDEPFATAAAPPPAPAWPDPEQDFQRGIRATPWFSEYVKRYGEEPDLNTPHYNYRTAWAAGARPDVRDPTDQNAYHWPSEYKGAAHPNRYVGGVDTITGARAPTQITVTPNTVTPKQPLPPEMTLPAVPPRQNMLERNLPQTYAPLQKTQQAIASAAFEFSPMGSLAELYDTFQARDAPGFGVAAAAAFPAARVAKVVSKGAKAAAEAVTPASKTGTVTERSRLASPNVAEPYLTDPIRIANPGVYKRPDVIAREANELVVPEHPALKELFNVTRDDLYGISQQGRRQGNVEPQLWTPSKASKPNEASTRVMTDANAQRLIDTLAEAQKYPELTKGMVPWYVMDPMYQRMVKLVGEKRAKEEYVKFNSTVAPFSAGSAVPTEINRGTAANMYRTRGELPIFKQYGNVAEQNRGPDFPADMRDVKGHMMHGNQIDPVLRYVQTGEHGYNKDTVKIPLYMSASGVPQTGFQTRWAVPDTHFASALGMPEVRTGNEFRSYMGGTEYRPIGPWYREKVAEPVGLEAVPAQALTWGTFAPQTGVRTGIGAGKLELLAQNIWERAKKLGIDPKKFRDDVLMGKEHALWLLGIGVPAAGAAAGQMGGVAAQDRYEQ